ncbi:MAG: 3-phosphoserine/phosphohydroxythreonine transaminase [Acidimicrobiia bacterium]|nr:MAG: 3-phosphoserine/phosphohydroxythreonine transaminase [Acidimicrobiia bacterium]
MRIFNFSAGPCTLPLTVLEEVQEEFVDYRGAGMSMVEMSHRSAPYEAVHQNATQLARDLFGTPDEFAVLFVQGGATMQFGMLAMNLLTDGSRGAYIDTGIWASKAQADGAHHGDVYTAWSGQDISYSRVPTSDELTLQESTRYLHVTSNETIGGVQFHEWPDVGVPLVADMSSDYMSRPIPWERFDLVYGGVQKNLAPAGSSLVFVRHSVLEQTRRDLASYFRYDIHASKDSMYNTPPVFPIYVMEKVLRWMRDQGGLAAMEAAAKQRAGLIYRSIDESGGFYTNPIEPASRSNMNVVFRIAENDLESRFIAEATAAGMSGLKGHRSVGGCRASVYNAMPMAGAEALSEFMVNFHRQVA